MKKKMICVEKDYAAKLLWDLDLLADELKQQSEYYKKRVADIRKKIMDGGDSECLKD